MPTKRITVSVPADIAARIKRAAGEQRSVSEWVTRAVTRTLEEEDLKRRFLEFCAGIPASRAEERRALAQVERINRKRDGKRRSSAA